MLVGYVRVSKADGSQTTNLQQDAMLAVRVGPKAALCDLPRQVLLLRVRTARVCPWRHVNWAKRSLTHLLN